jgi:hypothetical protein
MRKKALDVLSRAQDGVKRRRWSGMPFSKRESIRRLKKHRPELYKVVLRDEARSRK